jgi:serine/threonine-protein kinase HipA
MSCFFSRSAQARLVTCRSLPRGNYRPITPRSKWLGGSTRFSDLLAETDITDPVGIAGVQDRVPARMLSLPISGAHERYVLTLNPPEYPHVVENEDFFVALARRAKLRAVTARVVHDAEGRSGLLVTRFDRIDSAQGGGGLAVEDARQTLDLWPAD